MRLNPIWVFCLLLSTCARDPIDTPGTWKLPPTGLNSNDENLRAMVVNPRDLVQGEGDSTAVSVTAASAARRELTGRRAPLPNANVTLSTQGTSQQQQQGAGGAAGARTE